MAIRDDRDIPLLVKLVPKRRKSLWACLGASTERALFTWVVFQTWLDYCNSCALDAKWSRRNKASNELKKDGKLNLRHTEKHEVLSFISWQFSPEKTRNKKTWSARNYCYSYWKRKVCNLGTQHPSSVVEIMWSESIKGTSSTELQFFSRKIFHLGKIHCTCFIISNWGFFPEPGNSK